MTVRERSSALVFGGLAALYAAPAASVRSPALAGALGVDLAGPREAGVRLTFDDGPDPMGTPAVLDALDEVAAKATFFLVGEQVERSPDLAREIVERGHSVGIHCHRHRNQIRLTPPQIFRDLARADQAISAATGKRSKLFRPPYGALSTPALLYARRSGWTTQLWSAWGKDWKRGATAESIASTVAGGLRPGAIVLLHDSDRYGTPGSWSATAAAIRSIAEVAEERGLAFAEPPGLLTHEPIRSGD